jgi:LacI family transcriptional regulator
MIGGFTMDATIKDIARKLKVSYATVSRALNDKDGVKAETKRRIEEEAKRVKYRPNAIARGLVKRQTHTIGLIIPDITNPFFPEVARGVEDAAQQAGYSVFLCNTNWEPRKELHYIDLLAEKRVDGILIAPVSKKSAALENLQGRLPLVYISHTPPDKNACYVTIDNVRGGFLATEHLLKTGRAPVGFIGAPEDSRTLAERLKGYKTALKKYGEKIDDELIRFGDFRRETGYNLFKKMIGDGKKPKSIFGENDLLAIGALQGAREMGFAVPEEIAVVGFDDIPIAGFPEIELSTIVQPKYEMGKLAVEMLVNNMIGTGVSAVSRPRIVLEPRLILRKSA